MHRDGRTLVLRKELGYPHVSIVLESCDMTNSLQTTLLWAGEGTWRGRAEWQWEGTKMAVGGGPEWRMWEGKKMAVGGGRMPGGKVRKMAVGGQMAVVNEGGRDYCKQFAPDMCVRTTT